MTSTPSNAVMFASTADGVTLKLGLGLGPGAGAGLGFALFAAGLASALLALAVLSFAVLESTVFESLLLAITGRAVMASTRKLDNHLFTSNMDGLLMYYRPASWRARYTVRDCISFLGIVK
jgi:hypothetical protein